MLTWNAGRFEYNSAQLISVIADEPDPWADSDQWTATLSDGTEVVAANAQQVAAAEKRQHAFDASEEFAEEKRTLIANETSALRRDGHGIKGDDALNYLREFEPDWYKDVYLAEHVLPAYQIEVERRAQNEDPIELMKAAALKRGAFLKANALVEGNLRGLHKALETTDADEVDALLETAKATAEQDMQLLQNGDAS